MLEAIYGGEVIARSDCTVVVEGNHYFPSQSVEHRHLQRTRTRSLCPWKGVASYFTIDVDGTRARNAAWTYRHPSPFARRIKNHIAFRGGVEIREADPAR